MCLIKKIAGLRQIQAHIELVATKYGSVQWQDNIGIEMQWLL